jgi:hypothetical protein
MGMSLSRRFRPIFEPQADVQDKTTAAEDRQTCKTAAWMNTSVLETSHLKKDDSREPTKGLEQPCKELLQWT